MSRIGKLPVSLPKGVSIVVDDSNVISVKGPLGELKQGIDKDIKAFGIEKPQIASRPLEGADCKHGDRCITGVQKGT